MATIYQRNYMVQSEVISPEFDFFGGFTPQEFNTIEG